MCIIYCCVSVTTLYVVFNVPRLTGMFVNERRLPEL